MPELSAPHRPRALALVMLLTLISACTTEDTAPAEDAAVEPVDAEIVDVEIPDADPADADLPDMGDAEIRCIPGQAERCPGERVGICLPGIRTCAEDGRWGPCDGRRGPDAFETCNGLDDDCDGTTDENASILDPLCDTGLPGRCAQGLARECVDGAPLCRSLEGPIAELCNGEDDDCDGSIDEGQAGGQLSRACYEGPSGSESLGPCLPGRQICQRGSWGTCEGQRLPEPEVCDAIDNDCDGLIDDGNPDAGGGCETEGLGRCRPGTLTCAEGGLVCVRTNGPAPEACNGLDDDCDGSTDEGDPQGGAACFTGALGVCAEGRLRCGGGALTCEALQQASPEVCDGVDNDCDGEVDDDLPGIGEACETGEMGICGPGIRSCVGGVEMCVSERNGAEELCNTLDDDCDGAVDEGLPGIGEVCSTGLPGVCGAGRRVCNGAAIVCEQAVESDVERCDGADNDCDGNIDEGDFGGEACITGQPGVCSTGTRECVSGVILCVPERSETPEVCDGTDNDCDGTADEGNPGGGEVCITDLVGPCSVGIERCVQGVVACTPEVEASAETCDFTDNDCDGTIDEGFDLLGRVCAVGRGECAVVGSYTCDQSGVVEICDQQPSAPIPELCNTLDDDCDGRFDEGEPETGNLCDTEQLGVCATGSTICVDGVVGCEVVQPASEELCNALDDDCDGTTDEVPVNEVGPLAVSPGSIRAESPSIAYLKDGDVERLGMLWVDNRSFGPKPYFSLRGTDGQALAADLRMSLGAQTPEDMHIIAAHGGFAVVWADFRENNWEIYFNTITAEGEVFLVERRLTVAQGRSVRPRLLEDGDGYVVFWDDSRNNEINLYMLRLDADGTPRSPETLVTDTDLVSQDVDVVRTPDGGYALTWTEGQGLLTPQIFFKRLDADGQQVGEQVQLSNSQSEAVASTLAVDETGYTVVWQDNGQGNPILISRRLDFEGNLVGELENLTQTIQQAEQPTLIRSNGAQETALMWIAVNGEGDRRMMFSRMAQGQLLGEQIDLGPSSGDDNATPVGVLSQRRFNLLWVADPSVNETQLNFLRGPMGCP